MIERIELRKITVDDDIDEITSLIYDTDPYIYKDLLGERKIATRLLSVLLRDKHSYFYCDHFYGAFLDGKIVGIMSLVARNYEMSADSLRMAYIEIGETMTPAAKEANNYLFESYAKIGSTSSASNICVKADYRHKGIGDYILKKIISIAGSKPIELCVIADNIPAVKLYKNNGFVITDQKYEYGGYMQEKVLCYMMIRVPV